MPDIIDRAFQATLDCHYLLRAPGDVTPQTPLVVTLHGFGATPEVMLELTARLFTTPPVIAAIQGPYQFFRRQDTNEVGFGWITNRRPAESIRLHHDMVSHVLKEAGNEFRIPVARRILTGFSQSVSSNYRFAATRPDEVRGVIAICGGLPGDWDSGEYQPVRASVLHIARRADEFYPPAKTEAYPLRLEKRATDVEFHLLDGGHHMPSAGKSIVDRWVARILTHTAARGTP